MGPVTLFLGVYREIPLNNANKSKLIFAMLVKSAG